MELVRVSRAAGRLHVSDSLGPHLEVRGAVEVVVADGGLFLAGAGAGTGTGTRFTLYNTCTEGCCWTQVRWWRKTRRKRRRTHASGGFGGLLGGSSGSLGSLLGGVLAQLHTVRPHGGSRGGRSRGRSPDTIRRHRSKKLHSRTDRKTDRKTVTVTETQRDRE